MSIFKHYFWVIGGLAGADPKTIDAEYRMSLAKAATTVQSKNSSDVLFGLATGGDGSAVPTISLVVQVKTRTSIELASLIKDTLTPAIEKELHIWFIGKDTSATHTRQDFEQTYEFDKQQLQYAESYKASFDIKKTFQLHEHLSTLPPHNPDHTLTASLLNMTLDARTRLAATSKASNEEVSTEEFSIDAAQYAVLKNATHGSIKKAIESLQEALSKVAKETNTAAAAVVMATNGIATVGKQMWTAYQGLVAAKIAVALTPELIAGLIATCGLTVMISAVAAVVAVVGAAAIMFKDDLNIVLLVNGQKDSLTYTGEHLRNGECRSNVQKIDGIVPDAKVKAYPCGFYLYQKSRFATSTALGFYGSTAGISFQSGTSVTNTFAIGVDCPNTIIGGDNAIHVYSKKDAAYAATNVTKSKATEDLSVTLNDGKCIVKWANNWGNVNYCTALVTSE